MRDDWAMPELDISTLWAILKARRWEKRPSLGDLADQTALVPLPAAGHHASELTSNHRQRFDSRGRASWASLRQMQPSDQRNSVL